VRDLRVTFKSRGRKEVRAVDGVSLDVAAGATVGIVGSPAAARA
jgi:ABC-type glutathione transport system ATPase component